MADAGMTADVIADVITDMRRQAAQDAEEYKKDGDYYGEDGLLYCGKCHTKRQTILKFKGMEGKKPVIVKVLCKCESAARDAEARRRAQDEELLKLERLRSASLIETKYKDARLRTFRQTEDNARLYKVASRYVENFEEMYRESQGILFWGTVGTGKSYTAACIANELLDRRISVVMTSFVKILQELQPGKSDSMDETELIARLNSARLLIIDDLGTERNTDYALEKVYNIIDSRYLTGKPLILTTNLTLQDMQGSTDMRYRRIYDRIFEMCYPVKACGKSWRMNQAAERFDSMKQRLEG